MFHRVRKQLTELLFHSSGAIGIPPIGLTNMMLEKSLHDVECSRFHIQRAEGWDKWRHDNIHGFQKCLFGGNPRGLSLSSLDMGRMFKLVTDQDFGKVGAAATRRPT